MPGHVTEEPRPAIAPAATISQGAPCARTNTETSATSSRLVPSTTARRVPRRSVTTPLIACVRSFANPNAASAYPAIASLSWRLSGRYVWSAIRKTKRNAASTRNAISSSGMPWRMMRKEPDVDVRSSRRFTGCGTPLRSAAPGRCRGTPRRRTPRAARPAHHTSHAHRRSPQGHREAPVRSS